MTRKEYLDIMRGLHEQIDAARARRDEAHLQGAVMALEAFLSTVEMPPPDGSPAVNELGPSTR